MKYLTILSLLAFGFVVGCEAPNVSRSVSKPADYTDDGTFVLDGEHLLADEAGLEEKLGALDKSKKAQLKILVVDSLNGEDVMDFSQRVATKWALGTDKADNGILVVLAISDRKVRVHTGYGLEAVLTDQYCGEVSREARPYFKKQDYVGGLNHIVDRLIARLE